ncbi:MAG: pyridoxamine kinase [Prolixibacteraceae bacterium]|nr:pyridoxamine kinase [Prolixibacteraceae bacterium]
MVKKNLVPKVAAIHDLSGYGRASLSVVISILSNMGAQVCPLPTAVLSSHSGFSDFHFVDLTDQLEPIIEHWKKLDLQFDAIYSGYLGSAYQTSIVRKLIHDFRRADQWVVVDPVLGDKGRLYPSFDESMVQEMRLLIRDAQVITPNITEAAFLLNEPFNSHVELEAVKDWLKRLADMGPEIVVITSVPENMFPRKTSVLAWNSRDQRMWKVSCDYLPAEYPGTGDAFSSVIVGALLQGDSLPIALDRAVQFISMGVRATFGYDLQPNEGILLEKVLPSLSAPVQMGSYQLID